MTFSKYDAYLTKEYIQSVESVPSRQEALEKYMMNFKIHSLLCKQFKNLITRGGMAMPFYQKHKMERLSEDIDVLVNTSISKTKEIMKTFSESVDYEIKEYVPKSPSLAPILTYNVMYQSIFKSETKSKMKIDFLCDPLMDAEFIKIHSGTMSTGYFDILHTITILDRGALLADKLSSLAMDTIGYGSKPSLKNNDYDMPHQDRMPKQIYDAASILKNSDLAVLKQAVGAFMTMTGRKCEYRTNNPVTIMDVSKDISNSLFKLVDLKLQNKISKAGRDTFSAFVGNNLRDAQYGNEEYLYDLLLLMIFSYRLVLYAGGHVQFDNLVKDQLSDRHQLESYSELSKSEKTEKKNLLLENLPSVDSTILKQMKALEIKSLYMFSCVYSLRNLVKHDCT